MGGRGRRGGREGGIYQCTLTPWRGGMGRTGSENCDCCIPAPPLSRALRRSPFKNEHMLIRLRSEGIQHVMPQRCVFFLLLGIAQ